MAIIPDVQSVLVSAVASITPRVYRTEADENAAAPFVVWTIVSGLPENNISDRPDTANARIQIDCYSLDQSECRRLMGLALAAVEGVTNVIFGPIESREPDTKLWRWIFDASFWFNR